MDAIERFRDEMGEDAELRGAILLFDESQRLLLVRQRWPRDRRNLVWRPPGGALDPGNRALEKVAALEARLETGLDVATDRLVFLCQSQGENGRPRITAYFLARANGGDLISGLDYANGPLELAVIEGARFVSRSELQALTVRPPYLYADLWADLADGFREVPRLQRSNEG